MHTPMSGRMRLLELVSPAATRPLCMALNGSFRSRAWFGFLTVMLLALAGPSTSALAQISQEFLETGQITPNSQMLLEADELVYNNDDGSIAAVGNVQIDYNENNLVAREVVYYQESRRLIARGDVEILESNGNRIFADEIDITDDFGDGFVDALRVETPENTRFAADSAERRDGNITEFHNGVYTACEPCRDDPSKPPIWQIKASKIILNGEEKTVSYRNARFEFFGAPIAYLAYFAHADPSVKRKSGFLTPEIEGSDALGTGFKNSYFFNLAPNFDLTVSGTYFTRQGFLGEAEWRHKMANGTYNLRFAGIQQQNPGDFNSTSFPIDSGEDSRTMISSAGLFEINPRWRFGWQWMEQSDNMFAATYNLAGYDTVDVTNEVYLTGLAGKNYFDLRTQQFLVQNQTNDQAKQANSRPVLDYNYVFADPVMNGQLSYDFNVTSIGRHNPDNTRVRGAGGLLADIDAVDDRYYGINGETTRASLQTEWKSSIITNGGLVVTPSASLQADAIWHDRSDLGGENNPLLSNQSIYRTMPAAGLELRYPLVAHFANASHIFEPIAQIFARPDEEEIGMFANEDAQSLVFDTTNLFKRNKFSGYDRVEGGTRANVGFRYSASFNNGASFNFAAGQSFHLAGRNSFAANGGVVNAGEESGLETNRSDYVAGLQLNTGGGILLSAGGRFDEKDFGLKRGEISASSSSVSHSASIGYVYIAKQPNYAFKTDRHQINGSASLRLNENWRVFGAATYDLERDTLVSDSIGLGYDDECFSISATFAQTRQAYTDTPSSQEFRLTIGFRTIGDYGYIHKLDNGTN